MIRDVPQGIVPQRQNIEGRVIQDVDYLETVVRRERRGTSHGVSRGISATGLFRHYRPTYTQTGAAGLLTATTVAVHEIMNLASEFASLQEQV